MSSANPRRWRYKWETLAHIPTLRLYLFNPEIDPLSQCLDLESSLRLDESLLVVTWIGGAQIRVPVPRVLVDPGCPLECRANRDHIEIKLSLVLPVDHPLVGVLDAAAEEDRFIPLSLDSDLKALTSEGVHFFCKICSTKLTRQPLRRFVEMPSVNWREAADNWFGACCCSFGGVSEKLVSQYINTYECVEGTCLLDDASVIVCKEDLDGFIFERSSCGNAKRGCKDALASSENLTEVVKKGVCRNSSTDAPNIHVTTSCLADKMGSMDPDLGAKSLLSPADCCGNVPSENDIFSNGSTQIAVGGDFMKLNSEHFSGNLRKPFSGIIDEFSLNNQCHCYAEETNYASPFAHERCRLGDTITPKTEPEKSQEGFNFSSLGNGFIIRTSNFLNDVEWVEFSCRQCASSLGSYPCLNDINAPVDGGVRLFKCYISTCIPTGGPRDIFRKHSLQRVFVNSLLESAEDELCFRTIVRDLKSRSVMLQMVLLNSKAFHSTGYCFENVITRWIPMVADLRPIVKVLFSDCTAASEADSRTIKEWSTRTHVEEVYMMRSQIEQLIQHLNSSHDTLPLSLSSLQGMSLSSIER